MDGNMLSLLIVCLKCLSFKCLLAI